MSCRLKSEQQDQSLARGVGVTWSMLDQSVPTLGADNGVSFLGDTWTMWGKRGSVGTKKK